jgi:aarF domain-containing kinase
VQLVQKREGWTKQQAAKDKLWNNTHERNAKRILKAITELKGLWVKAGQYLSTRADVLPSAYIRNLSQLQDSLPPRPLSEVQNISFFVQRSAMMFC